MEVRCATSIAIITAYLRTMVNHTGRVRTIARACFSKAFRSHPHSGWERHSRKARRRFGPMPHGWGVVDADHTAWSLPVVRAGLVVRKNKLVAGHRIRLRLHLR